MDVDIKQLERIYFSKNKPVEFKLRDDNYINIYPILVKEWDFFEECYDILTIEKRDIPDIEIIQMSYLEFLYKVYCKDDKEFNKYKLNLIMSLTLHEPLENIRFIMNGDKVFILIVKNEIVEKVITSKDFDNIKKIILYQNIDGYDDTFVSYDIRKAIKEQQDLESQGMTPLTLEDKMVFLGNKMGKTNEDFMEMTYREFSKRFDMAVREMDYKINRTAELSGNVKFKNPIEHFLFHNDKDKYARYFTDKDTFMNKINNA